MKIDILIYDGCLGSEVFAFADTLNMAMALDAAGQLVKSPTFEVRLVSTDGRARRLAGGIASIPAAKSGSCDLLVIPGMEFADREALVAHALAMSDEHQIIRRHWQTGKALAAICVGSFIVAASGIASDRHIATGWPVAPLLHMIDPSIDIEYDALVVSDGALSTTGALTATYELALRIVASSLGEEIATRLRRLLLLEPNRAGQAAFARMSPHPGAEPTSVHKAKAYLRANISAPFSLVALSAAAGTSVRSLQRNFKRQTGITPLAFHQHLRIDRAKHLLEISRSPIGQIAVDVGFIEETAFRALFRRMTGFTPREFRRRFALFKT
jgi:transcriptional regulator GlxA family with amidase domain